MNMTKERREEKRRKKTISLIIVLGLDNSFVSFYYSY